MFLLHSLSQIRFAKAWPCRAVTSASIILLALTPAPAQVSKGHQILIDRGILRLGLSTRDNPFNINTARALGLQGPLFEWGKSNPALLGPAPGVPWGRWASSQADMPPLPAPFDEQTYMANCVAVQLADEQDINQETVRKAAAEWFNAVRDKYPHTLLYVNNWGGQIRDDALVDFIKTSNPDMLSQDTYPWTSVNRYGGQGDDGAWPGGSPKYLYNSLRVYRAYGLAHNKPVNLYTQTFQSPGEGFRTPSDSEMRLNYFTGVAFGVTSFMNFDYNRGSTVLFSGPGDQHPTSLYSTLQQINAKLDKLSPALVRLKPRSNYHGAYDGSIMYVPGQYMSTSQTLTNTPPSGDFLEYPLPYSGNNYANYFASNDPAYVDATKPGWFRGIESVTNLGSKNNGLRGDVWVMWFKPLDESFDGPSYTDERYIIVLNGLSSPTGAGVDCRQKIVLNFENGPAATTALRVINQFKSTVETMPLSIVHGVRQATFQLNGGEMALFKFNTGAPFVGIEQPTSPAVVQPSPTLK